ncbi:MAG TPA: sialidase family protein [Kiritimatiellia bacterium]|nr:sialidase family protein [Kiritimatiellia bacterium]
MGHVPGVVLPGSHEPSPAVWFYWDGYPVLVPGQKAIYTTSPSIAILPDGSYLVTANIFGNDTTADVSGTTKIWRSSDQGATWIQLNTITNMKRGSVFVHEGDVYLWGYTAAPGDVVIRKSTDRGESWTVPTNAATGLLTSGTNWGGTPHNPVFFSNRVWMAQGGTRAFSAPLTADLLQSNVWTITPAATVNQGPLGSGLTVTEAQIVSSPHAGVVVMPKIGGLPNSALLRVSTDGASIKTPYDEEWVALPGGEKKFGASYDPLSGRFYVLSNPVLAAHTNEREPPEMVRNAAAISSSTDLRNWNVEALFLYSPNVDYEGFQYLNFAIEGDDLLVAARTAFDVGGNKPPRGHDSNLITFHRVANFRTLGRDHRLSLTSGVVRRVEKTQHRDAPFGSFALGGWFEGAPLSASDGFAVSADGVYIREVGGRILRFDFAGNFLETVPVSPEPIQAGELPVPPPTAGDAVWMAPGSGHWHGLSNWFYWKRAVTRRDTAVFGSAATGPATIQLPAPSRRWRFDQAGQLEGWELVSVTNVTVSGGVLRGRRTGADDDLALRKPGLNFEGRLAPEVRIRMRADVPEAVIDFQWGISTANARAVSRRVLVNYTGNGEFQELIIPMTGVNQWHDRHITRLFISPRTGLEAFFEIDEVRVMMDTDGVELAGLRFRNSEPYTLSGETPLRVNPENGNAHIDVARGSHTLDAPVVIHAQASLTISNGAMLAFRQPVRASNDVTVAGAGMLSLRLRNLPDAAIQCEGALTIGTNVSLDLSAPEGLALNPGDSIPLIRHGGARVGTFAESGEGGVLESGGVFFSLSYQPTGEVSAVVVGETFARWARRHALPSGQDSPDAAPAGDGVANAIKYLLGRDPLVPFDPDQLPRGSVEVVEGIRHLLFDVPKDAAARRGEAYVEISEDLLTWTRNDALIAVFEDSPGHYTAGLPLGVLDQGYIRLMVRVRE